MKKKLLKLLGMLVILCMLFATVGCAKTTIIGTWEANMDLATAMNEAVGEVAGIETDFEDLTVQVKFKVNKDETYTFAVEEDSVEDMLDNFFEQFKDVMKDMLEDAAGEFNMTVDEIIEGSGYDSFDDYFEAATATIDPEDMLDSLGIDKKGTWKLEGNKLWLGDGDDIDEDTYYVIELKGKTMTWEEATGEEEEMSEYLLPLTFKKK